MSSRALPWGKAMAAALYGPEGFYVTGTGPGHHFRTSAHSGLAWPAAIAALAERVERSLGEPADFAVVDVGAGGGELLAGLARIVPPHWALTGVDVAERPPNLPSRVGWQPRPPTDIVGLIIANELLDVVPVDIAVLTAAGPCLLDVTRTGVESVGASLTGSDLGWQQRWWPLSELGGRAELGSTRDDVWHGLTDRLSRGLAVAIDYAAVPARHTGGTLTGFRHGRQVRPVPDGSCDLTAHVLFDSLTCPGDLVRLQRDVLRGLGMNAGRPRYADDPTAYLCALQRSGEVAELIDDAGLGDFSWLLHARNLDLNAVLA